MRKRFVKLFMTALIVAAVGGMAFAGGGAEEAPERTPADEIRVAFTTVPDTLHGTKAPSRPSHFVNQQFYDYLVGHGTDGELVPGLATSWEPEHTDDGLVWYFTLREGVEWHNGDPVTAEHIAQSLEFAKSDESARLAYTRLIEEVEVVDDNTIAIHADDVTLPRQLCDVMMVPVHLIEEMGESEFLEKPIGTGAYKVVEHAPGEYIRLERNENWYGGEFDRLPDAERVRIDFVPEASTRVSGLLGGTYDFIIGVPPDMAGTVEGDERSRLWEGYSRTGRIKLAMQMGAETGTGLDQNGLPAGEDNPFLDQRVREAVYRAINLDRLVDEVLQGYAEPMAVHAGSFQHGYDPTVERLEHDPDLARELLDDAGYPDGFAVRLDAPGDRFTQLPEVGQVIQSDLRDVGIDAQINVQPWSRLYDRIEPETTALALVGSGISPFEVSLNFSTWFLSGAHLNFPRYANSDVDEMYEHALTLVDDDERAEAYKEIMDIIVDDIPYVPMYLEIGLYGTSPYWEYEPRADAYPDLNNLFWAGE